MASNSFFIFYFSYGSIVLPLKHPAFVPEDTQYAGWHGFDILVLGSNGLSDANEFSMEEMIGLLTKDLWQQLS